MERLIASLDFSASSISIITFAYDKEKACMMPKDFKRPTKAEKKTEYDIRLDNLKKYVNESMTREELLKMNFMCMNPFMMAITYGQNFILEKVFSENLITPDELRAMKNSEDYNVIRLCKIFDNEEAEKMIKDYVSKN